MKGRKSRKLRRIEKKARECDARLDRLGLALSEAQAESAKLHAEAVALGAQRIRAEVVRRTGLPEHYLENPRSLSVEIQEDAEAAKPGPRRGLRVEDRNTSLTTDRADPRLTHGDDTEPRPQADAYLVLSEAERAKGFVRPVRRSYVHLTCGAVTTMGQALAETYARDPGFYSGTYCATCRMHRPVGEHGEFIWDDGSNAKVGT